ncbi:unnamed protein product, partial [Meganyctiphanes norvegica]
MDFLECKICHVPYDEEDHRPRHAPCGHEYCSACIKALIKDNIFECPKCRQKNKVCTPDDMPVNFGLIDVIRAFQSKSIPLAKESVLGAPGAANDEVCDVHCKAIAHWCFKCQLWICDECLEDHSTLMGCSTDTSTKALKGMKDKQTKDTNSLLTKFEEDTKYVSTKLEEHTKLAEKHGEEAKKLRNLLEEGKIHKEKLEESKKRLNSTISPLIASERIKVLEQRKHILRSWSVKNLGTNSPLGLL